MKNNKYTIKVGQSKDLVLQINDLQSVCPFTQPIPVPGNVGQIQIMRMPCTSLCPHVKLKDDAWCITCGGQTEEFPIEEEEIQEPKLTSKIIDL